MENTKITTKECTKANKPLVSIVLATYNANLIWLEEQLDSLNRQTYENLELIVLDDCSSSVNFKDIENLLEKTITNFDYKIYKNEKNIGSNKTFEKLTDLAVGEYIAYCDQDDIWNENKIEKLIDAIINNNSVLSYCDMNIIDDNSIVIEVNLKAIRPRLEYLQGKDLMNRFVFSNCIAGCSMIVEARIAEEAMPFPLETVCDHWISIIAANEGNISFVNETLVNYRQHGNNQTGILTGVNDKKSYYENRLKPILNRVNELKLRIALPNDVLNFVKAREEKNIYKIWKYKYLCKKDSYFEILLITLPNWIIIKILKAIKE